MYDIFESYVRWIRVYDTYHTYETQKNTHSQHKIFSKITMRARNAKAYNHLSECLLYWPGTFQTQKM